jgi:antitoxin ParD1/3/4
MMTIRNLLAYRKVEALRLMDAQDRLQAVKLEQLRQDIQNGLESGDPSPWNAEEIKQAGRHSLTARNSDRVTGG